MGLRKPNASADSSQVGQAAPKSEAKDVEKAIEKAVEKGLESGPAAAIERLKNSPIVRDTAATPTQPKADQPRDYSGVTDPKSVRILRQGVYQHALISPAVAGMKWNDTDQFLALVKEIADKTIAMIMAE